MPTLGEKLGNVQLLRNNCEVADWIDQNLDMEYEQAVPEIVRRMGTPLMAMVTLRQITRSRIERGLLVAECLRVAHSDPAAALRALSECERVSAEHPSGLTPDEVSSLLGVVRAGPEGGRRVRELELRAAGTCWSDDAPTSTALALVEGGVVTDIKERAAIPPSSLEKDDWRPVIDNRVGVDLDAHVYHDEYELTIRRDAVLKMHRIVPRPEVR